MDVLIKGMKMPKGCITCMFKFESLFNRTMWCEWLDDPLGDYSKCDEKWRHPDCPLVEVPTPHGRLIDGDNVIKLLREQLTGDRDTVYEYYDDGLEMAISELSIIPTIIEAEEGEKNDG